MFSISLCVQERSGATVGHDASVRASCIKEPVGVLDLRMIALEILWKYPVELEEQNLGVA